MKLHAKFNLAFFGVFLIGLGATGYISYALLHKHAREEIALNAKLLMQAAQAARAYTTAQISPLLDTQMKYTFLPQSVPAYSATEVFSHLRKEHPEYTYKEATLNPTNPRDRAVDWESDVIERFRTAAEPVEYIVGERDTPHGRSFYVARPIQVKSDSCLRCHSTPDAAPQTLLDQYGSANGFGWKVNEIVGAQIVSVPTDVPIARANAAFSTFMLSITGVFVVIGLVLNLMLRRMVVKPITELAAVADKVSLGDNRAPAFPLRSKDEIGLLAVSLGRMRKSLDQALKMLDN